MKIIFYIANYAIKEILFYRRIMRMSWTENVIDKEYLSKTLTKWTFILRIKKIYCKRDIYLNSSVDKTQI